MLAHVLCALAFASCMCFAPDLFKAFLVAPAGFTPVAQDSVRWACGFVFGFGGFAAASLWMPASARSLMARVFCGSFAVATACGAYAQTTGRWNEYHPINIALFGTLAVVYFVFSFLFPGAFERRSSTDEAEYRA